MIIGAKGGLLRQITVGDVVELLEARAIAYPAPMPHASGFYRMLHRTGSFQAAPPQTLRELTASGPLPAGQLVDPSDLPCKPAPHLLVDSLQERQPPRT